MVYVKVEYLLLYQLLLGEKRGWLYNSKIDILLNLKKETIRMGCNDLIQTLSYELCTLNIIVTQ